MKKLLFFLLTAVLATAQIKTVHVTATGFGSTYSEAVQDALVNAVAQVRGIGIKAQKEYQQRLRQVTISVNGKSSADIRLKDGTYSKVSSATGGFVKRFDVLSVRRVSPHEYEAKVRAYFDKYKSPGFNPRNRRSLAVLPFETKKAYAVGDMVIGGKELSRRITQAVVSKLTQTRKFTVLDRENSDYYRFEKRFLLSGDSDPMELARLGRRLGADYFVIGQILDFGIRQERISSLIGPAGSDTGAIQGYATVAYRVLAVATQQIKWSDTFDVVFPLPKKERAESLLVMAGDQIAQILTDQLIYNIYPPKIVDVQGRRVIVNMGGNTLHSGERFVVFGLGKRLKDPYTGESLGREEVRRGEIEITRVTSKVAYGRLIEGRARKGDVIRPEKGAAPTGEAQGRGSAFDEMFAPRR